MMRTRRQLGVLAAFAALMLVAAGCSGGDTPGPETEPGDGSRVARNEDKKKGKAGAKKDGRKKGDGKKKQRGGSAAPGENGAAAEIGADGSPAPAAGGAAAPSGGGFASDGPPSPVDPSLARRSSSVDDSPNDAQKEGVVPDYGELVGAKVQGLGEHFEMRMNFGGTVPERTESKNTIMVIGFGISAGGNDTYGFTAQASPDGWKAYAGAKHKARKFPGRFFVEGESIVMQVPWKFINGPREFRWQANSTWFRTIANTTHYSFDMVPDKQAAQFPN